MSLMRNFVRLYLRQTWRKECNSEISCEDCKYGCGKLSASKQRYVSDCTLFLTISALYQGMEGKDNV